MAHSAAKGGFLPLLSRFALGILTCSLPSGRVEAQWRRAAPVPAEPEYAHIEATLRHALQDLVETNGVDI